MSFCTTIDRYTRPLENFLTSARGSLFFGLALKETVHAQRLLCDPQGPDTWVHHPVNQAYTCYRTGLSFPLFITDGVAFASSVGEILQKNGLPDPTLTQINQKRVEAMYAGVRFCSTATYLGGGLGQQEIVPMPKEMSSALLHLSNGFLLFYDAGELFRESAQLGKYISKKGWNPLRWTEDLDIGLSLLRITALVATISMYAIEIISELFQISGKVVGGVLGISSIVYVLTGTVAEFLAECRSYALSDIYGPGTSE